MTMRTARATLAGLALLAMAATIASMLTPSTAMAGNWAQVCCGTGCSPGDYCVGTGTYTCCKDPE